MPQILEDSEQAFSRKLASLGLFQPIVLISFSNSRWFYLRGKKRSSGLFVLSYYVVFVGWKKWKRTVPGTSFSFGFFQDLSKRLKSCSRTLYLSLSCIPWDPFSCLMRMALDVFSFYLCIIFILLNFSKKEKIIIISILKKRSEICKILKCNYLRVLYTHVHSISCRPHLK